MDDQKPLLELFEVVKIAVVARQEKIRYRIEIYQMYSDTQIYYKSACWVEDEIAGGKRGWVTCPPDWTKRADTPEAALNETLAFVSANATE
jgi:hypothetical protein